MKRRLTILGVCALVVLVAVIFFSSGNGGKQDAGTTRSLLITQDGKLTLVAQPDGYAKPTIIMNNPKPATNAASPATNSNRK